MKRFLLAAVAAFALEMAATPTLKAGLPVIDIDNLWNNVQQLMEMKNMLDTQLRQLQTLRNVPQQLIGEAQGLLDLGVSNPLQDIMGNLQSLMNGSGTGTCHGSSHLMDLNQYASAMPMVGGKIDFAGAQINGAAARGAGLLACTNQMMEATQRRLTQMPELLSMLQSCTDITCEQGVSGRIAYEQANIQTQQLQAQLMWQNAQQQRWTAEDQITQKQRADADTWVNETGGANAAGTGSTVPGRAAAPMFSTR